MAFETCHTVIDAIDGATAAFEAIQAAYPGQEVTLRQGCRVVRTRLPDSYTQA